MVSLTSVRVLNSTTGQTDFKLDTYVQYPYKLTAIAVQAEPDAAYTTAVEAFGGGAVTACTNAAVGPGAKSHCLQHWSALISPPTGVCKIDGDWTFRFTVGCHQSAQERGDCPITQAPASPDAPAIDGTIALIASRWCPWVVDSVTITGQLKVFNDELSVDVNGFIDPASQLTDPSTPAFCNTPAETMWFYPIVSSEQTSSIRLTSLTTLVFERHNGTSWSTFDGAAIIGGSPDAAVADGLPKSYYSGVTDDPTGKFPLSSEDFVVPDDELAKYRVTATYAVEYTLAEADDVKRQEKRQIAEHTMTASFSVFRPMQREASHSRSRFPVGAIVGIGTALTIIL